MCSYFSHVFSKHNVLLINTDKLYFLKEMRKIQMYLSGYPSYLKLSSVAQLDARLTDDQEVAAMIPPGLVTFFHGD